MQTVWPHCIIWKELKFTYLHMHNATEYLPYFSFHVIGEVWTINERNECVSVVSSSAITFSLSREHMLGRYRISIQIICDRLHGSPFSSSVCNRGCFGDGYFMLSSIVSFYHLVLNVAGLTRIAMNVKILKIFSSHIIDIHQNKIINATHSS